MKYKRYISSNLKSKILLYISKNFTEYLIIFIILLIGIIFGTLYIRNLDEYQQTEINNYITNFIDIINNGGEINFNNLLKSSIKNNLIIVFLIGITGLTAIGLPILYLIVIIKGFSIGYTISSIVGVLGKWKGIKFSFATLFLQNIIIIPSIICLSVSGIKLCKTIIKDRRKENIKIEIVRYLIILSIITALNILASLIESYVSANIFMCFF